MCVCAASLAYPIRSTVSTLVWSNRNYTIEPSMSYLSVSTDSLNAEQKKKDIFHRIVRLEKIMLSTKRMVTDFSFGRFSRSLSARLLLADWLRFMLNLQCRINAIEVISHIPRHPYRHTHTQNKHIRRTERPIHVSNWFCFHFSCLYAEPKKVIKKKHFQIKT